MCHFGLACKSQRRPSAFGCAPTCLVENAGISWQNLGTLVSTIALQSRIQARCGPTPNQHKPPLNWYKCALTYPAGGIC